MIPSEWKWEHMNSGDSRPKVTWARRLAVGLVSGALLATTATVALADEGGATADPSAPATVQPVQTPAVEAQFPAAGYAGVAVPVTVTLTDFTQGQPVLVEAQLLGGGAWSTQAQSTVTDQSLVSLDLPTQTASTQVWRVTATQGQAAATSAEFTVKFVSPTVSVKASTPQRLGSNVKLTGSLANFLGQVTVRAEMSVGKDKNGKDVWKPVGSAVKASGTSFSVAAPAGTSTPTSKRFRVTATEGVKSVSSAAVKVTLVPQRSVSINDDRIKLLSAQTNATGTVKGYEGKVTVRAQARVAGEWVTKTSKSMTVRYTGTKYSLPLKYKIHNTGKVKWRTLVTQGSAKSASETMSITRTLKGIDKRCLTGRVMCVSKKDRKLRWMIDGAIKKTLDARFGAASTPTRNGSFTVFRKSRDHVSSLFGSKMPFAMFFSGGQAVHFSSDFLARGYAGASHGCVNIRDREGIKYLFDKQVKLGDKVVVY